MARKRKLDKGVSVYVDRHGKERARFRLNGISCPMPHPSSPEYKDAYTKAVQGIIPIKSRYKPRSVGDLFDRFYRSNQFQRGGAGWQRTVRQSLEAFRTEASNVPVSDFDFTHIEEILRRRSVKRIEDKKKFGGPKAAERLHEQLIRLFDFAIKRLQWIDHNPARAADMPVVVPKGGYHTWTDAEIERFRARHEIGTKARLALEIALWGALRRGDVAKLGPRNLVGGRIIVRAGKTEKDVNVIAAPELLAAIEATPIGNDTFLVTSYGKPFSDAGLGNWFRDRCNEAGLPQCSLHGLRKALTRQAAQAGATQQQLKALGQWAGDAEVAIYARDADQMRLADAAVQTVIERGKSSNRTEKVSQKDGAL